MFFFVAQNCNVLCEFLLLGHTEHSIIKLSEIIHGGTMDEQIIGNKMF